MLEIFEELFIYPFNFVGKLTPRDQAWYWRVCGGIYLDNSLNRGR